MTRSTLTHLECGACAATYEPDQLINLCRACGKPLLARYDLSRAAATLTRESLAGRRADMWRYQEVLPVRDDAGILSLGEGWTPLMRAARLGRRRVAQPDRQLQGARSERRRQPSL